MLHIHPNARTTPVTRAEIARSDEPSSVLAKRYGVSAGGKPSFYGLTDWRLSLEDALMRSTSMRKTSNPGFPHTATIRLG